MFPRCPVQPPVLVAYEFHRSSVEHPLVGMVVAVVRSLARKEPKVHGSTSER
jgi:hypothetical protein